MTPVSMMIFAPLKNKLDFFRTIFVLESFVVWV